VGLFVAREAAEKRVPHVPVRLDKAWQHDHIGSVDYLSARCAHLPAHRNDLTIAYMHSAARNVAKRIVHSHHMAVANDELAACRQAGRHRLRSRKARRCKDTRRTEGGCSTNEVASTKIAHEGASYFYGAGHFFRLSITPFASSP